MGCKEMVELIIEHLKTMPEMADTKTGIKDELDKVMDIVMRLDSKELGRYELNKITDSLRDINETIYRKYWTDAAAEYLEDRKEDLIEDCKKK